MKNPQYLVLGLGIIIFLALCSHYWGWKYDDAYEENVYAAYFAGGKGFVFNIGGEHIEGYACFLWELALAALILLNFEVSIAGPALGVICGVLSLLMLYKLSSIVSDKRKFAAFPSLFMGSVPAFAIWATSGVETSLFTLLLITSIYLFLKEERGNSGFYYSSIAFLLLSLTRHEGLIVFFMSLLFRGLKNKKLITANRDYQKKFLVWLFVLVIPYGLYTVWRLSYFGDLFPNPFYAKSSLISWYGNISAMLLVLTYLAPFIVLGALGVVSRKLTSAQKYVLLIAATLLVIIWRLGGWHWAYRYAIPVIPLILVFSQSEIERLFTSIKNQNILKRLIALLIPLFLVLYLVYPVAEFDRNFAASSNGEPHIKFAEWFNKYYPNATLAFGDIGLIRYYSNITIIDVAGLNNRYIAHHGFSVDYILQQNPEFVMLISQGEDSFISLNDPKNEFILLYNSPAFHQNYTLIFKTKIAQAYYYWTYARKELTVSPEALANHP